MSKKASSAIRHSNSGALYNPWVRQNAYEKVTKQRAVRRPPTTLIRVPIDDVYEEEEAFEILPVENESTGSASKIQVDISTRHDVIAIRSNLKNLKQEFELSYVELADLTNSNHSGIRNFIEGETEKPREETLDSYQALVDVLKILSNRFSNKPLTKKAILRRESDAFSGLSIIQYSKQLGADGIFTLRGELRRMYE